MYKTVWNFMNHHVKSSHVSAMFLAALLAGWTLIGLLTGSVVCLISAISLSTKTVVLFCSTGYTGLIFGFFGGIFYLYQKTSSQIILYKCTITTRNPKGSLSCLFYDPDGILTRSFCPSFSTIVSTGICFFLSA